ncbi:hypothetical protein [Algibacter sp. L4_22]|uniref:hypothetical protein n=1 Tax=Algibacter sp. L4_22 TaxID=2942477 RepID=UPI00201B6FAA|nr:hypothetical protein [Algibacter sp. L4_22]MCL5127787.1 hypothetical protein [Algibacter sp. L4_22]
MTISWDNVWTYYNSSDNKIDLMLVNYLNLDNNYKQLKKNKYSSEFHDNEIIKKFTISLIECNGLTIESYKYLLKSVPNTLNRWNNLGLENLDEDKVMYLINNHFLTLSESNYDFLREIFPNLKITLIEDNQQFLIQAINDEELSLTTDEVDSILNSINIKTSIKSNLLANFARERIINETEIAKIAGIVFSEIGYKKLKYSEINSISKSANSNTIRMKILENHFDQLIDPEIQTLVSDLSGDYKRMFIKNKRPRFNNTKENLNLIERLYQKNLIKKFSFEKEGKYIRTLANTS